VNDSFSSDLSGASSFLNGQRVPNGGGAPPMPQVPSGEDLNARMPAGAVQSSRDLRVVNSAAGSPSLAPGAPQAGPAGASTTPPGPPGSLAQGPAPRPAPGTPGTLAMGMPKWDPATIAQDAPAYAKAVSAWARGHVAAKELRDRWGHDVPSPGAVSQSSQPGAPGAASFSPTVQSLLTRLRAQGWSNVQVPGVGHVIRHPSGKSFVFHPENGSLTPFNSTPSLAQGVAPTAQVG
jgi:hypothetical protein